MVTCFLLLLGMGWASFDDAHPVSQGTTVEIVEGDWGDARPEDIQKILRSVVECMEQKTGVVIGENLRVESSGGPMVLYQRDKDGSYRIKLQVSGRYWSQLVYQFSHEVGHILVGYQPNPGPQEWLEEAVCEAMSFRVLRSLSVSWKVDPPFERLRGYAQHLSEYAVTMEGRCTPVTVDQIGVWYESHRSRLESSIHDRPLIRAFSRHVSTWLEDEPGLWKKIPDLGKGKGKAKETVAERIGRWTRGWKGPEQLLAQKMLKAFSKDPAQAESGSSKSQP